MNILKIGKNHIETGMNCQDAIGRYGEELKVVCDGCSEGKHSEVGAKLFTKLFTEKYKYFVEKGKTITNEREGVKRLIQSTMDDIVKVVGDDSNSVLNYLSFTTVISHECMLKDSSVSFSEAFFIGDGYLIKVDNSTAEVSFMKLDCGEYPEYLSYNYLNPELLKDYKKGAEIHYRIFDPRCIPKHANYKIGVASDGIRFVADLPKDNPLRQEFVDIILSDRDIRMKRFINKHPEIFKDDVSIVI